MTARPFAPDLATHKAQTDRELTEKAAISAVVSSLDDELLAVAYRGMTKKKLRRRLAAAEWAIGERRRVETNQRADALFQKNESVLQEAQRLVHGARNADYGPPAVADARTAAMLKARFGWDVKATDIWQVMVLLKISREANFPKRDNRVDIAGYAEVGDWIHRGRA